jgi:hypothetical protein
LLICHLLKRLNLCLEATWHGRRNCRLTLHYENGFTLTSENDTIFENGGPAVDMLNGRKSGTHTILWHYPFEKLQMSWDDGHHLLCLDFGEDGEQVFCFVHLQYGSLHLLSTPVCQI